MSSDFKFVFKNTIQLLSDESAQIILAYEKDFSHLNRIEDKVFFFPLYLKERDKKQTWVECALIEAIVFRLSGQQPEFNMRKMISLNSTLQIISASEKTLRYLSSVGGQLATTFDFSKKFDIDPATFAIYLNPVNNGLAFVRIEKDELNLLDDLSEDDVNWSVDDFQGKREVLEKLKMLGIIKFQV